MRVLKSVAVWLLILALAVLNGIFREAVLLPSLSKPVALVVSGLLLAACIIVVATVFARWLGLATARRGILIGCLWLSLTLVFEFSFGGLVQGKSRAAMLEAYAFKDGNIWPMVLMVTLFAPLIASRIHRLRQGHAHEIA
jgi:hypothetical protein